MGETEPKGQGPAEPPANSTHPLSREEWRAWLGAEGRRANQWR